MNTEKFPFIKVVSEILGLTFARKALEQPAVNKINGDMRTGVDAGFSSSPDRSGDSQLNDEEIAMAVLLASHI